MSQARLSLAIIILTTLSYTLASMFNGQPQLTIKALKNKKFNNSCLINEKTFNTGSIADCLEHCLEDCRCQSFQICGETKCQLCSSHKELKNSSLLHDNDTCIYAMYEMRHAQKFDNHCSTISCPKKYNCCQQQSDLCPSNKICKPFNSPKKPWKRFTCECRDGYRGNNCDKPIRSCGGYRSQKSGMYKVRSSVNDLLYEVYCHFDSDGAWTLVQSFSFANHTIENSVFRKPLSEDHPVSQNAVTWSGYRLSRTRMQFINQNSDLLRFTCAFEDGHDVDQTDYLQMSLEQLGDEKDITANNPNIVMSAYRGKIKETDLYLEGCKIKLHQKDDEVLHVHIDKNGNSCERFGDQKPDNSECVKFEYFSYFSDKDCLLPTHRCTQNEKSTSQLWFGKKPS